MTEDAPVIGVVRGDRLLRFDEPEADKAAVARFIAGNDHFYLNLAMPAAKACADAAAGVDVSRVFGNLSDQRATVITKLRPGSRSEALIWVSPGSLLRRSPSRSSTSSR